MEALIEARKQDIKRIGAEHGAVNIRVFGSAARGEFNKDSDIDLLVDVAPRTSSWFPAGLILDLERLLGRRVEIITERALNRDLRDQVLKEAIPL